jgi:hypothetical protein
MSDIDLIRLIEDARRRLAIQETREGMGGAAIDHASLVNLPWTASAHTGTAARVAAFLTGTGAATELEETGTGKVVLDTSPTIVTPTIASFLNANHTHAAAGATGGALYDLGQTILSHFSDAAAPTGHSYAAAPFATPTYSSYNLGGTYYYTYSAGAERVFLQKASTIAATNNVIARCRTSTANYIGVRIDDGTDDNYVECYLEAASGMQTLKFKARTGGGAVTTTATALVMSVVTYGFPTISITKNALNWDYYCGTVAEDGAFILLGTAGTAKTWVPSRIGVVVNQAGASDPAVCDWIKNPY